MVPLTAYDTYNGLYKLSGQFDEHKIDFGVERLNSTNPNYQKINLSEQYHLDRGFDLTEVELERTTFSVGYEFNPESDFVYFEADVYHTDQSISSGGLEAYDVSLKTFGLDIQNSSEFSEYVSLTYGINFRQAESRSINSFETDYLEQREKAYGAFFQTDIRPIDIVTLSLGGRYDTYKFEDAYGERTESSKFSPNASIAISPIEGLTAKAGYAEAYRGAGIRDAYFAYGVPDEQEEAQNLEFSLDYETENFFAKGSYFKQQIDNYIYPQSFRGVAGDLINDGYEITAGFKHGNFRTSLSVTESNPEIASPQLWDGEFPEDYGLVISGRLWQLKAEYEFENTGVTLGGALQVRESVDEVASSFADFPSITGKDSYTLVDVFARWEVAQVKGLSLQVNVDNIFDEDYQEHTIYKAFGVNSPGRQLRIGATYEF